MISNLISFMVSYRLQRQPIYEALAHQEGVRLPSDELREQISRLNIGKVMHDAEQLLSPDDTLERALAMMKSAGAESILVVGNGSVWGAEPQTDRGSPAREPVRAGYRTAEHHLRLRTYR